MKVAILYHQFYDHEGQALRIGGVETYLLNLARLCRDLGWQPTIHQWAERAFTREVEGIAVEGVPVCGLPFARRGAALYRHALARIDARRDLLIFGADHKSVPTNNPRHLAIQHGVSWDLPARHLAGGRWGRHPWLGGLVKWRMARWAARMFENAPNVVCVDYNFLNWYRTRVAEEPRERRVWVIPNFTPLASAEQAAARDYDPRPLRVLFARRFVEIRGTRIFAPAVRQLLAKDGGVAVTFAGEGPEEGWLRQQFAGQRRVSFTRYQPDEALAINRLHDVAVVPSLASEGTSLSVAEAMATACPVIATAVGGVTNMILHQYNGLLVRPNAEDLGAALSRLTRDAALRQRLGQNGYATAREAFSLAAWRSAWQGVLEQLATMDGGTA